MKRAIIEPAVSAPEALSELKQWLAITADRDDPALTRLIGASLDMFEAFTGSVALETTFEELLPATGTWQAPASRPVSAVLAIEDAGDGNARSALPGDAAMLELGADGSARVRVVRPLASGRIAVRFVAGLAASWNDLPDGVRHGVIRCAAHLHNASAGGGETALPAAVTALWRPWRSVRLL